MIRRYGILAVLGFALGTAVCSQAFAQSGPVCAAKTLAITESADDVQWITFDPTTIGPACSGALKVTSVSAPAALVLDGDGQPTSQVRLANTLDIGASMSLQFEVTDATGATVWSTVTVVRKTPEQ